MLLRSASIHIDKPGQAAGMDDRNRIFAIILACFLVVTRRATKCFLKLRGPSCDFVDYQKLLVSIGFHFRAEALKRIY